MSLSLLIAAQSSPPENLSIFDPASPSGESIKTLSYLVFFITGIIFFIVEGILIYCLIRFRHRPDDGMQPPQVYGSKPIEIAWTAAPALVVFVLVLVVTRTLWAVNVPPPEPTEKNTLFVTVIGKQWWWEYRYEYYDGEKIVVKSNGKEIPLITSNELRVPADIPVYLTLKSADVCHSFWVPRLGGKTDLIPGRTNHTHFQTNKTEVFLGQCAEYCGTQHANMLLRVVVESKGEFETWLDGQKTLQTMPELKAGSAAKAFFSQSCVNCHRINGTTAQGTYGPDLTHLMSRKTLASGMIKNDDANLRAWVRDPQKIKPGCLMPAFGLKDRDLDLVVEYLKTLE
jgi:cytochrome c oxidase subunit 2